MAESKTTEIEAPNVPAAFINAIAEEGTKAEAVKYLQQTWNERCQLERELAAANERADKAEQSLASARQAAFAECLMVVRDFSEMPAAYCYRKYGTASRIEAIERAASLPPTHVCVPREPKAGLICGDVAVSTDPQYAGWVFVRHVDGENWTTGAKLTPETWGMVKKAMLAAHEGGGE